MSQISRSRKFVLLTFAWWVVLSQSSFKYARVGVVLFPMGALLQGLLTADMIVTSPSARLLRSTSQIGNLSGKGEALENQLRDNAVDAYSNDDREIETPLLPQEFAKYPREVSNKHWTSSTYCPTTTSNCVSSTSPSSLCCSGCISISTAVTSLNQFAFQNCFGLRGPIVIPDTVTSLGVFLFYRDYGITSLTLGSAVAYIGNQAFQGCANMTGTLTIPNSCTDIEGVAFAQTGITSVSFGSAVANIGTLAFSGCNKLSGAIVLPTLVTYINANVFTNTGITSLTLGSGVKYIGLKSFYQCLKLNGTLIIPNATTYIDNSAFMQTTLQSVIFGTSLKYIGQQAFYACWFQNCGNLMKGQSLVLPASLTYIDNWAFAQTGLSSVRFGSSLLYIGQNAFSDCSYGTCMKILKGATIVIPNTVTFIDNNAFMQSSLVSLILGTGLLSIGASAFCQCSSLTGNLVIPNNVVTIGATSFSQTAITSLIIGSSVTYIGPQAFSSCSSLSGSLVIPNSVTFIDSTAFAYSNQITALSIGTSVVNIGANAFAQLKNLASTLVIPDSVTNIGSNAFAFPSLVPSIIFGSNLKSIGDTAFYYCTTVSGSLVIPNSVTYIGNTAFYGFSITSVSIGTSVVVIAPSAFVYCGKLAGRLVIPDSTTIIGGSAFLQTAITSLVLGSSVTYIGNSAFYGTTKLSGSLVIPNNATFIGNQAFELSSIQNLTLGTSLKYIGQQSFLACTRLSGTLVIPGSVTNIDSYAFQQTGISSLIIGSSVSIIGGRAFWSCTRVASIFINSNVLSYINSTAFTGGTCQTGVMVYFTLPSAQSFTTFGPLFVSSGCTSNNVKMLTCSTGSNPLNTFCCSGNVVLSSSITSIISSAFQNCAITGTLTIPNAITAIANNAFQSTAITSLIIGSAVTSIGSQAFARCSQLSGTLSIPDKTSYIGDGAFNFTSISSLLLGSSVTYIGVHAFRNCSHLRTIYIASGSINYISPSAFSGGTCKPTVNVVFEYYSMYSSFNQLFSSAGCVAMLRVPSSQPTTQPSSQPVSHPSTQPTKIPSRRPSSQPTRQPSLRPSRQPLSQPSSQPSRRPSLRPSQQPTAQPQNHPSNQPSRQPSVFPSSEPSMRPSRQPTKSPSSQPMGVPSSQPSIRPTTQPQNCPSNQPSSQPSVSPSSEPSMRPSRQPSRSPSSRPTGLPSTQPSQQPTAQPQSRPSDQPTSQPSVFPSSDPSMRPSRQPTVAPSSHPTWLPSSRPSQQPTKVPSKQPTYQPATKPSSQPSVNPSKVPSCQPSSSPTEPTSQPAAKPSKQPASVPTSVPSVVPQTRPTVQPTVYPSSHPTAQPRNHPSSRPSLQPSHRPSCQPTRRPSSQPIAHPTRQPSAHPSIQPTMQPYAYPSRHPSSQPTTSPSKQPSGQPTKQPRSQPTGTPSRQPSTQPTQKPSNQPSSRPTGQPSQQPASKPSLQPLQSPTGQPSRQPSDFPSSQPSSEPSQAETIWRIDVDNIVDSPVEITKVNLDNLCMESTWRSQNATGRCHLRAAIAYCTYRVPWLLGHVSACHISLTKILPILPVQQQGAMVLDLTMGELVIPAVGFHLNTSNEDAIYQRIARISYSIVLDGCGVTLRSGAESVRQSRSRVISTNITLVDGDVLAMSTGIGTMLELMQANNNLHSQAIISNVSTSTSVMTSNLVIRNITVAPYADQMDNLNIGDDATVANGGCISIVGVVGVTIQGVHVQGCWSPSKSVGGGVFISNARHVEIANSVFASNLGVADGGGVAMVSVGSVDIRDSIFDQNIAHSIGGGLLIHGAQSVTLTDSSITNNYVANGFGGGLSLYDISVLTIEHCFSSSNIALFGSALAFDHINKASIADNIFSRNAALRGGTIFWLSTGRPPNDIEAANVFMNNTVTYYGPKVATETVGILPSVNVVHVNEYGPDAHRVAFELLLTDYYQQRVTSENNNVVRAFIANAGTDKNDKVSCSYNNAKATLTGETAEAVQYGSAHFNLLAATLCIPGGSLNATLSVNIDSYSAHYPIYGSNELQSLMLPMSSQGVANIKTRDVEFKFRHCHRGEILDFYDTRSICQLCENSYSLAANQDNLAIKCSKCPTGAKGCVGAMIYLTPGTFRWSISSDTIISCLSPDACIGGNTTGAASCHKGYGGAACSICSSGYFRSLNSCQPCKGKQQLTTAQIGFYVAVALLGFVLCLYAIKVLFYSSPSNESSTKNSDLEQPLTTDTTTVDQSETKESLNVSAFQVRAKMVIIALQIIITNSSSLSSSLPPLFSSFVSYSSFLTSDLASSLPLECTSRAPDFFENLTITVALPVAFGFLLLAAYSWELLWCGLVFQARDRPSSVHKAKKLLLQMRYVSIALLVSFFLLPNISVAIFKSFDCVNLDPSGDDPMQIPHYVLRSDPTIDCYSEYYKSWLPYVYIMILVYPFGLPMIYFLLLYSNRHDIQLISLLPVLTEANGIIKRSPHASVNPTIDPHKPRFVHVLTLFYFEYKPQYWFWELVEVGRRLLLTCVVSVFLGGSTTQLVCVMIVNVLSIWVLSRLKPFSSRDDNDFAETCQWQVFATFYCLLIIKENLLPVLGNNEVYIVDHMMIAINVGIVAVLLYVAFLRPYYTRYVDKLNIAYLAEFIQNKLIACASRIAPSIRNNRDFSKVQDVSGYSATVPNLNSAIHALRITNSHRPYLQFAHRSTRAKFATYLSQINDSSLQRMQYLVIESIRRRIRRRKLMRTTDKLKSEALKNQRFSSSDAGVNNSSESAAQGNEEEEMPTFHAGSYGYMFYLPVSSDDACDLSPADDRVTWDLSLATLPAMRLHRQDINHVRFVCPETDDPRSKLVTVPDEAFNVENYRQESFSASAIKFTNPTDLNDPVMQMMSNLSSGIPPPPRRQSILPADVESTDSDSNNNSEDYEDDKMARNNKAAPLARWDLFADVTFSYPHVDPSDRRNGVSANVGSGMIFEPEPQDDDDHDDESHH